MANQRGTFSKRNREMKLKDRAKDKADRLAQRRSGTGDTKGPQIAWDQPGGVPPTDDTDQNDTATPGAPSDDAPAPGGSSDTDR